MSACFDTSDVLELSRATLEETNRRLSEIPTDLCALFHADASNLEQQLLGVYRTVVLRAREEDISAQVTNRHQFDRIEKTICWVRL